MTKIEEANKTLTDAFKSDPDFAHTWQSNIAMPIYDNSNLGLPKCNEIADVLMKHLFDYSKPPLTKTGIRLGGQSLDLGLNI